MITGIGVVTVYVSDHEKALDFYVHKLGFEKLADTEFGPGYRWLEVAPPGSRTRIVLAKGFGDGEERIGKFTGIVFEPDDIQATYQTM